MLHILVTLVAMLGIVTFARVSDLINDLENEHGRDASMTKPMRLVRNIALAMAIGTILINVIM